MKKCMAALLLFTLLFTSCTRSEIKSCAEIVKEALGTFEKGQVTVYDMTGKNGIPIDETTVSKLFFSKNPVSWWQGVDDAVFVLGRGAYCFEIMILHAKHLSEAEHLKELLEQRIAMLQKPEVIRFLNEKYDVFLSSATIYEYRSYVFLLITGDNFAVFEKLKESIKEQN